MSRYTSQTAADALELRFSKWEDAYEDLDEQKLDELLKNLKREHMVTRAQALHEKERLNELTHQIEDMARKLAEVKHLSQLSNVPDRHFFDFSRASAKDAAEYRRAHEKSTEGVVASFWRTQLDLLNEPDAMHLVTHARAEHTDKARKNQPAQAGAAANQTAAAAQPTARPAAANLNDSLEGDGKVVEAQPKGATAGAFRLPPDFVASSSPPIDRIAMARQRNSLNGGAGSASNSSQPVAGSTSNSSQVQAAAAPAGTAASASNQAAPAAQSGPSSATAAAAPRQTPTNRQSAGAAQGPATWANTSTRSSAGAPQTPSAAARASLGDSGGRQPPAAVPSESSSQRAATTTSTRDPAPVRDSPAVERRRQPHAGPVDDFEI